MERLSETNIHNLMLSENSIKLLNYYQDIIKKREKALFYNQKKEYNSDYYKLQTFIYNNLDYIYHKLKSHFRNKNSIIDFNNYRKIISSQSLEYTKLVSHVYYKHLNDNKYISNEIKKYIIKTDNNYNSFIVKYNFNHEKIDVNIHFIIYLSNEKECETIIDIINKYDKYVFHMLALLSLVIKLTNNTCSKDGLNIYIFKTPFERKIENKLIKSVIGANNINGGFCYGCTQKGDIVIYRDEEFFKVFSHELCHNFGIDKYIFTFIRNSLYKSPESEMYNNFINNFNLSKKINREKYDIGIQESLIEFWGIFLNTSLFVFNTNYAYNIIYYNKVKNYIDFFEELFKYEITHSFFQTQKVLSYNNVSIQSILSTTNVEKNKLNNYRETTHVFSYIVIKLFLLVNYKEFINSNISIKRINKTNPAKYIVGFHYSLKNITRFFDYIISISHSNSEYIKTNLHYFSRLLKNKNSNKFITNNMRMSSIEIQ